MRASISVFPNPMLAVWDRLSSMPVHLLMDVDFADFVQLFGVLIILKAASSTSRQSLSQGDFSHVEAFSMVPVF